MTKPHSLMGLPEAEKVLRLLGQQNARADGELGRMAIEMGIATLQTDAYLIEQRMKQAANDTIRWHSKP